MNNKQKKLKLTFLDYLLLAIICLKATGWLPITWPQALALPVFLFSVGLAQGLLESLDKKKPEGKSEFDSPLERKLSEVCNNDE